MKTIFIIGIVLFVLNGLNAQAAQPPFHSKDPGTEANFNEIYRLMATHTHDGNGTAVVTVYAPPIYTLTQLRASTPTITGMTVQSDATESWALFTGTGTVNAGSWINQRTGTGP